MRPLSYLTDDRVAAATHRVEIAASLIPLIPLTAGVLTWAALRGMHSLTFHGIRRVMQKGR